MSDQQTTPESFESALAEFEALVEKMERGDLSLEDSVGAYERGVVLHRYCEEALSAAERKVRILTEGSAGADGNGVLQDFEPGSRHPQASNEGDSAPAPPSSDRGGIAARETEKDELPF